MPAFAGMTVVGVIQKVYLPSLKEWIKICLNYTLKNVSLGLITEIRISMKLYYKEFRGEPLMLL
jgi:hypothetical protein